MRAGVFQSKVFQTLLAIALFCIAIVPLIYFIINNRPAFGILVIIGLIGVGIILICFLNPEMGFIFTFLFCSFIFIIARIIGKEDIPYGIIRDAMLSVIFLGVIVQRHLTKPGPWIKPSPIFITYVLFTLYLLIQFFNPDGSITGWLVGMRSYISYFILYLIIMHILKDYRSIVRFTKLWLVVFFLAALYTFYQEWAGLPDYDYRWVTANPKRIGLNFSGGRWDLWSFFSDVAAFGITMAFSGIFCVVMSTGPFSRRRKLFFLISGLMMFLAMVYSGNRTAFAIVPFGLIIFALQTLNNPRTLWVTASFGIIMVILVFGPFYGTYINRVRTAFFPMEDASMQLRDRNRAFVQPYIYEHPIGGGFMTTGDHGLRYAPNHELAGFPSDSLYLETALEMGWIGLVFQITFYFLIVYKGVSGFFNAQNRKVKILYLAYTCGFFALTIAAYAKKALFQVPLGFVLVAIYVIMDKLIDYDSEVQKA